VANRKTAPIMSNTVAMVRRRVDLFSKTPAMILHGSRSPVLDVATPEYVGCRRI
jgi:hypothetical protein